MAFISSYRALYASLLDTIGRSIPNGVKMGGTAGYPRVELHSFIEGQTTDKGNAVRVLTTTIEAMSDKRIDDVADMIEDALAALEGYAYDNGEVRTIGVVPTQLQDMTDTADTKTIIYRLLQSVDVYVEAY